MKIQTNNSLVYDALFRIGMWWRILYGFFRIAFGFVLWRLVGTPLADIFYKLMRHELVEDPTDLLIQIANPFVQHSSLTVTYFLAIYFVFWGIVDVVLSINLLKKNLWAFPISIVLIGIFILYEVYRFSYTHSIVLAGVIIVDLALIWVIRKEYLQK